ncbi:hypothetical protein SteCoe_23036 [Stentor coeruleus]|uniref:protein-tyrosine-phosphatase n=1 Tax=Stentor coeruleus TaxID=5963 RepID=A0A1R2BL12_9CILI|nr:hypothetical protein SteCoe_23036 [Stentor coeruleus]
MILQQRLLLKPKQNKQGKPSNTLSATSLSVLYSSWSSLSLEEKSDYKVLGEQFKRNYVRIRKSSGQKKSKRLVQQTLIKMPQVLDLKEIYRLSKNKPQMSSTKNPMQKLIYSIKNQIQDISYKANDKNSITTALKNSIFDSYIIRDEPFQDINEAQISRIPFKENLLVSGVRGEIYISGIRAASDLSLLMKNDIKAVVSIGNCKQAAKFTAISGGYFELPIKESEDCLSNFKEYLLKTTRFIDLKLKEGNVLISCFYGVCRSCAIVIAYLMKKYMVRLDKALAIVKSGRKCCNLSAAGIQVLTEIEFNLFSLGE